MSRSTTYFYVTQTFTCAGRKKTFLLQQITLISCTLAKKCWKSGMDSNFTKFIKCLDRIGENARGKRVVSLHSSLNTDISADWSKHTLILGYMDKTLYEIS